MGDARLQVDECGAPQPRTELRPLGDEVGVADGPARLQPAADVGATVFGGEGVQQAAVLPREAEVEAACLRNPGDSGVTVAVGLGDYAAYLGAWLTRQPKDLAAVAAKQRTVVGGAPDHFPGEDERREAGRRLGRPLQYLAPRDDLVRGRLLKNSAHDYAIADHAVHRVRSVQDGQLLPCQTAVQRAEQGGLGICGCFGGLIKSAVTPSADSH